MLWHWLKTMGMRHAARIDAARGIEALPDQLQRRLPPKPQWAPQSDARQATVTAALGKEGELDEIRHDIANLEDELRLLPSAPLLLLGILILLLAEAMGASLLLAGLGIVGVEQLILSVALTASLIFLTERVVEAGTPPEGTATKRPHQRRLLIVLYVVTLLALAIARGASVETEVADGGIVRLASSLVLLAIVAGPSWLIEKWVRDRKRPAAIAAKLASLRQQERQLTHAVQQARTALEKHAAAAATFEQAVQQFAAEYRLTHLRERAATGDVPALHRRRKP